mmetsp:Transcript_125309/g.350914  ORF Transcript_125309/g.350914 Transcript_125309/m.350914 type:complete len:285 (+) Transcript_125309:1096-1950(+)
MAAQSAQRVVRSHSQLLLVRVRPHNYLEERRRQRGEELAELRGRGLLHALAAGLLLRDDLDDPADVGGDPGHVPQLVAEDGHQLLHRHDGLVELRDAPKGPRHGVPNGHGRVLQGPDEMRVALLDKRAHLFARRPLHDGAIREQRRLPVLPVRVSEVRGNEAQHEVDAIVLDHLRQQAQASARGHSEVPRVIVLFGHLPHQRLSQQRHEVWRRLPNQVEVRAPVRNAALQLVHDVQLLVANSGPELHRGNRDLLRRRLDGFPRQRPDRAHVRQEEVVVLRGDLD